MKNSFPFSGIALALLGFALFSMHDAVIKSLSGIHAFQIAFFVCLFSFVPVTFMLAIDGEERSLRPRLPLLVGLRCLFTSGSLLSAFYAFGVLPLADVYALLFAAPILITMLAIPVLGETVRLVRWVAILLGMTGVLVVLGPNIKSLSLGHISALIAAICIACSSIVTRKIGDREHSVTLILYPMLCNIVVSGLLLVTVYVPVPLIDLGKLACIGLLSVVAQRLIITAYRASEAQFIAPMQYSQMLWAVILGAVVFNEPISQQTLAGALIIILSGIMFIWRELQASVMKPILRTRNFRVAGGPQAVPGEIDSANSTNPANLPDTPVAESSLKQAPQNK